MAEIKNAESMQRFEIPFFEGVNNLVADNLSKKEELKHAENARSRNIGTIEKRQGTSRLGDAIVATENYGLFFFENDVSAVPGIYRISKVSSDVKIYYLNGSAVWTTLVGTYSAANFSHTMAEDCAFLVNGEDNNMYIKGTDGTTIVDSTTEDGHFYNSPKAKKTNYFKERLYLADYTNSGGTRYKNGIMMSSRPLGIVALVDGDHVSGDCGVDDWIKVTDVKYIRSTDTVDVYRGGVQIAEIKIKDKTEDSFQIESITFSISSISPSASSSPSPSPSSSLSPSASTSLSPSSSISPSSSVSMSPSSSLSPSASVSISPSTSLSPSTSVSPSAPDAGSYSSLDSSDEIWVNNTYEGDRFFRWADAPMSGIDVLQYDTFKIAGGQNDRVKMMTNVGNIMVISNSYNLAIWDGSSLRNLDNGIGCVSDRGYAKAFGSLFFLGYKGIYQMAEGAPELISSKVQEYIDGATKTGLEAGAIGVKGTNVFCSIGDVTLYNVDGSENKTLSAVVLEKNLKTQNWYIHTGITATQFDTYVESSNPDRLLYSSTDSNYPIFEFLTGTLDNDNEIPFRIDTGNIGPLKEFERYFSPQKIIVDIERGSGMTCFISLDDDPFYELQGTLVKGCSVVTIIGKDGDISSPPRCKKINISIRDYSKQLCKISRTALLFKALNEEEQEKIS